jgi:hypothetical protein
MWPGQRPSRTVCKAGRPRICSIHRGHHSEGRWSYVEEVRHFSKRNDDNEAARKHCSFCHSPGHNARASRPAGDSSPPTSGHTLTRIPRPTDHPTTPKKMMVPTSIDYWNHRCAFTRKRSHHCHRPNCTHFSKHSRLIRDRTSRAFHQIHTVQTPCFIVILLQRSLPNR